ncbi:diguanylate cyclase [Alcaligenaceae bacterium]|nr:diguanylate cyclase [Alcaligenaceae bacterium]
MALNIHPEAHIAFKRAKKQILFQWLTLALALAVLGIALGTNLYLDYNRTAIGEQDRLTTQARIVAQNMELQLTTANRVLEDLLNDLSIRQGSYDTQAEAQALQAISNAMQGIHSMGVMSREGLLLTSSRPENIGSNFSHRDYFQATKRQPTSRALHVSAPYQDSFIPYAITITRAILGPGGEFQGLVYATLDSNYFQSLMASVRYAPDMWDAAIHGDGLIFLSVPERDGLIGANLAQTRSFFTIHKNGGKSTSIFTGKVFNDDATQIIALHTVQPASLSMDKPLTVAMGRTQAAVFSVWKTAALAYSGLYVFIALVTLLGLYAYQRRQREFDQKEALANTALRLSEENHRLIVENTVDLVVKLKVDGSHTYANPAFLKLYGVREEELEGKQYWNAVLPEDRHLADDYFEQMRQPPYNATCNLRSNTVEGIRYLHWAGQALLDDNDKVNGFICIGRDVTQQIQHLNKLEEQAQKDQLTGLANRRHFMHMAGIEFARSQRYKHSLSLLALDIDHFKTINDTYGHQAGDLVLQKFSDVFHDVLREVDIIGRIGGEEFAVLLPETDLESASKVAQRLLNAIAENHVTLSNSAVINYTASVGVAALSEQSDSLSVLLNCADTALYQAKNLGRNRAEVADAQVAEAATAD